MILLLKLLKDMPIDLLRLFFRGCPLEDWHPVCYVLRTTLNIWLSCLHLSTAETMHIPPYPVLCGAGDWTQWFVHQLRWILSPQHISRILVLQTWSEIWFWIEMNMVGEIMWIRRWPWRDSGHTLRGVVALTHQERIKESSHNSNDMGRASLDLGDE